MITLWKTQLVVAECSEKQCKAVYYPDHITFKGNAGRRQRLLCNAKFLRISKTGLWAHRNVAYMQENCVNRFHCGWSSFADFYNDTFGAKSITIRQSQRLFVEHFARKLIKGKGLEHSFDVEAELSCEKLMSSVSALFKQGGDIMLNPDALNHVCADCTWPKHFKQDLLNEGAILSISPYIVVEGDAPGHDVCISLCIYMKILMCWLLLY